MKCKLQIFLLLLSLFASVSTTINTAVAEDINENYQSNIDIGEKKANLTKTPKPTDLSKELQAFLEVNIIIGMHEF